MGLSPEDVRSLVAAFEASDWDEMSVSVDGTRLHLSRAGGPSSPAAPAAPELSGPGAPLVTATDAAAAPAPVAPEHPTPTPDATPADTTTGTTAGSAQPAGGLSITSPSVGLFWRSPQPGAPPFVDVGQHVELDDTVCIVEVMKLMHHVKAGVAGTVRAVAVENGDMVEHGQTLFVVEPAG